jgi:hypothetical protein
VGTSGAFTGSNDPNAKDLRHQITDWLDSPEQDISGASAVSAAAALGLWGDGAATAFTAGGSAAAIRVGAAGATSSGVRRSAQRVASSAGRAGAIASAYRRGDRAALEDVGLDLDELRALDDPREVGRRILDVVLPERDDSLAGNEERWILAKLMSFMFEQRPDGSTPSAEEIVRKTIELMVYKGAITECGDTIRKAPDGQRRANIDNELKRMAAAVARRAEFSVAAPTRSEISAAVAAGIRRAAFIVGASS